MKEYSDKLNVEMSYTDLSDIVRALLLKTDKMLELEGPAILIRNTIARAERLNELLKAEEFDHWTEERFQQQKDACNKMEERKR